MASSKKTDAKIQTVLITFGVLFALQGVALVTMGRKRA
jgi:hypothetical protein